jgi:hypothetical protein
MVLGAAGFAVPEGEADPVGAFEELEVALGGACRLNPV